MTAAFQAATAVRLLAADEGGRWRYRGEIAEGWDIGGVANGGYVLAMTARAMATAAGRPPVSITAHYLTPGRPGAVAIEVDAVRIGGRLATLTASLRQGEGGGDPEILRVMGIFGTFPADDAPLLTTAPPPDLPPFDDPDLPLRRMVPVMEHSGLPDRLDIRLRPGDEGFATGRPAGRPEVAGWFALADQQPGERLDAFGVLLAADAFYPPIFNSGLTPTTWVPTLQLTVHLRAEPVPGPLAARFRTDVALGGLLGEDGDLWDSAGRLVAQSRQLALMPR